MIRVSVILRKHRFRFPTKTPIITRIPAGSTAPGSGGGPPTSPAPQPRAATGPGTNPGSTWSDRSRPCAALAQDSALRRWNLTVSAW